MKMHTCFAASVGMAVVGLMALAGCATENGAEKKEQAKPAQPPGQTKKVAIGKNVSLEIQGDQRRVLVNAYICERQGALEQLLTRTRTKEHEAILAADLDARDIHLALNLANAKEGKPVQFRPKFVPPSGTTIKVFVEYEENNKKVRVPAQKWVRHAKTKKDLEHDFVFAGSFLREDPLDKTAKPFYAANEGDVICLSNFDTALLDLPIDSSQDADALLFEAHTERIPAKQTPVLVILEPVLPKKDAK